jgi:hypothetical protein
MDPMLQTALVAGGIFLVSYLIGRSHGQARQEDIIGATIDHLIDQGYLYSERNAEGEVELIRIREISREFNVD